jgi:hypothetical protein
MRGAHWALPTHPFFLDPEILLWMEKEDHAAARYVLLKVSTSSSSHAPWLD